MVKKLLSNRRGVSPIVADLLMVFITVAAFSLMFTISNQWISLQRVNQMQTITERLIIEDAWFRTGTEKFVSIAVTNVGKIDLKIRYVQINRVTLWEGSEDVEIGKMKWMNIYLDWTSGNEYRITVITDRGNRFEAVFASPS